MPRAHLDVVGLQREPHPLPQLQGLEILARQLQPPDTIDHRELLRVHPLDAGLVDGGSAMHLRRDPAVPDPHRAPHVLGDRGIVRDDDDRDEE